jgi:hypothetical protein
MKKPKLSGLTLDLIRNPDFQLTVAKAEWEETANPYYVWQAIGVCVGGKKAFPEWVNAYLSECSWRMTVQAGEVKDLRKVLPWALGFPNKRGPGKLLNPELPGSPDRWSFPMRSTAYSMFQMRFATRVHEGEEPREAMHNAQ